MPSDTGGKKIEKKEKRKCGKWNQRRSFDVRRFYVHTHSGCGIIQHWVFEWNESFFFAPKWRSEFFFPLFSFRRRRRRRRRHRRRFQIYFIRLGGWWWVMGGMALIFSLDVRSSLLHIALCVCYGSWLRGMSEHVRLHKRRNGSLRTERTVHHAIRWMSSGLSCDGYKREIYYYVALVLHSLLYIFRRRRWRR